MSDHEEKDRVRAEALSLGGPPLETRMVLNIEALGAVTPKRIDTTKFPKKLLRKYCFSYEKSLPS